MRQRAGGQDAHIRRIRKDALVQRGIVGQRAARPQPRMLVGRPLLRIHHVERFDPTHLDGSLSRHTLHLHRHLRHAFLPGSRFVLALFRWRDFRHIELVAQAFLVNLERTRHIEDGFALLDRHHATGGETFAITDTIDVVHNRHRRIARPQEVPMQRMARPAFDCA